MNLSTSLTFFLYSVWVLLILRCRLGMISAPVCVLLVVSFWVLFDDHGVYCSVEGQSLGGSGSAASSISPSQHTHTHSRSVRGMMIAEILFSTDSWKPRVSWLFIYNNRFLRAQKIRVVANVFFPRHLSTVHPVWTTRHLGFITT